MPLKFTYITPEGGLAFVIAVEKSVLERDLIRKLSDEEYREIVVSRSIPEDAQEVTERDASWEPPADRTFRNAWEHLNGEVSVNMDKAREIWRNKIRLARKPLLEELDTAYIRADEVGDTLAIDGIVSQKQELRDAPNDPAIEEAKNPEELKAIWPSSLSRI